MGCQAASSCFSQNQVKPLSGLCWMLEDRATACKADCLLWRITQVRPQSTPQLSLPQLAKAWLPVVYSGNKSLFCFGVIMAKCGCGEPPAVTIPQRREAKRGCAACPWSTGWAQQHTQTFLTRQRLCASPSRVWGKGFLCLLFRSLEILRENKRDPTIINEVHKDFIQIFLENSLYKTPE